MNVRAWIVAAIAGASTFDPSFTGKWGFYIAAVVVLTTRPWKATRTEFALIAFLAWAWASTRWAQFPNVSADALRSFAVFGILFLAVRRTVTGRRELQIVAAGYLAGCTAAVALTLAQDRPGALRATIDGVNSNYLAYSLAAGAAVAMLWWHASQRTLRQGIGLVAYTAVMLVGIFLTGTRGAAIGIGLVAAWAAANRAAPRIAPRLLASGGVAAAALVATGNADSWLLNLQGETRADGTLAGRLVIWPVARQVWSDSWWHGIGVGGFRALNPLADAPAHNVILEAGAGLGIIGVILFVFVLSLAWFGDSRGIPAPKRGLLIGAAVAATLPAYLSGAFEYIAPSWIVLALFSRAALSEDQERAPRRPTRADLADEQRALQVRQYQADRSKNEGQPNHRNPALL